MTDFFLVEWTRCTGLDVPEDSNVFADPPDTAGLF